MKLSSKEIFTFLGCVLGIGIVAFLIIKLALPMAKVKEKDKNNNNGSSQVENGSNGGSSSGNAGSNNGGNGSGNGNGSGKDPVYTPVYLPTEQAISLGNQLYNSAQTIYFDPFSYSGFVFKKSDKEGFDTKIVNYTTALSKIFKDTNIELTINSKLENNTLYLNSGIRVKDFSWVSTELLLTNIETEKITFTARSIYCEFNNDKCTQEQMYYHQELRDRQFIIEKVGENWLVTFFEPAY